MTRIPFWILATAFLIAFTGCKQQAFDFNAGNLTLSVDATGKISRWMDQNSKTNLLAKDQEAPLIQIRKSGNYLMPVSFTKSDQRESAYQISFIDGTSILLGIESKGSGKNSYLRLELLSIEPDSIDLVVWGPYPLTVGETVGETVGVVRNSMIAAGIQSLNLKTLGGFPSQENDIEPSYDIFESGSLIDVADSVKVFYRGQTAKKEPFGSVLQAYCRDRSQERTISNWGHDYYVAPAFEDGGVIGSSISLFSCSPDQVLHTISEIEILENLPHPKINGKWSKTDPAATAAYIITSFGVSDFEDALELTQKAGLRYLYHDGPFENWGTFDLNPRQFPENWETMKLMVQRAAEENIILGVHTLSNFITPNDPLVTPIPNQGLARVGNARLMKPLSPQDKEIFIDDPRFFNQMQNNTLHAAVIGNEIIRYTSVSDQEPYVLLNCERGAFGTMKSSHDEGAVIGKLMDHPYRVFLTDNQLSMEMSDRLAQFFNFTGCGQISFDGLEGNWSTGMGQYGRQRFTQNWYDKLNPELKGKVVTDASNPGHFFWHMFTRMNWGEPWYAGFRESQTQYRLLNQLYFQRNYIPAMLGWFKMTPETSIEDIEWLLARSAGFDAGYAMVTHPSTVGANGFGNKLLDLIRLWESARMARAFSEDIRKELQDIKREFHLEANGPGSWTLYPYELWRAAFTKTILQPGQPNLLSLQIENPNPDQPVQFLMTATGEGDASAFFITIDGARDTFIPVVLPGRHHLKYTGGSYVDHYTPDWKLVERFQVIQDELTLTQGSRKIEFQCSFSGVGEQSVKIEMKTAGLGITLPVN